MSEFHFWGGGECPHVKEEQAHRAFFCPSSENKPRNPQGQISSVPTGQHCPVLSVPVLKHSPVCWYGVRKNIYQMSACSDRQIRLTSRRGEGKEAQIEVEEKAFIQVKDIYVSNMFLTIKRLVKANRREMLWRGERTGGLG